MASRDRRKKPRGRDQGEQADVDDTGQEREARRAEMAERERQRLKGRDRSSRVRPANDSERRVQQRRQKNSRHDSLPTPTPQAFFNVAMMSRVGMRNTYERFDEAVAAWSEALGRKAWLPHAKGTCLHIWRQPYDTSDDEKQQRAALLSAAGVRVAEADMSADSVFVGEERAGRPQGQGARMYFRIDSSTRELGVSCYDGRWLHNRFTGRGVAKHHNGDYEDGLFCDGYLYDGFRVTQTGMETVRRTPAEAHPHFECRKRELQPYVDADLDAQVIRVLDGTNDSEFHDKLHAEGCPRLSAMDDLEFDSLTAWAEEEGRLDHAKHPTAGFGDNIIDEWHESDWYNRDVASS